MFQKVQTGRLGELYTQIELIKRGVDSVKMESIVSDFDLLCTGGISIEVKSATVKSRLWYSYSKLPFRAWQFANHYLIDGKQVRRDRRCDYFVFVGFEENGDVGKFWIVDKETIGTQRTILIPDTQSIRELQGKEGKPLKWDKYLNSWDILVTECLGNSKINTTT